MNCCNANGQCDQGKDCPVRKQRIKEVNDAYANERKYITTEPFKPDYNTEAVLVEEMQRMAKRIEELEAMLKQEREACANMCMAVPRTAAYFARLIRERDNT